MRIMRALPAVCQPPGNSPGFRIKDVKAGRHGARYQVNANDIVATRLKCGLSQSQFAAALKISPRTLQQWEQGRRQPSGAADTLLKIIARHPEVLREVMAA